MGTQAEGSQEYDFDKAAYKADVNVHVVDYYIARFMYGNTRFAGQTLEKLVAAPYGGDPENGLVLCGTRLENHVVGRAFDAINKVLGRPGRAYYEYPNPKPVTAQDLNTPMTRLIRAEDSW